MKVKAFQGFRFNPDVVGNAALCIAPPYDVIDPDQQDQLYQRSEFNIVRIIKGRQQPGDNELDNVYQRAAQSLRQFIDQNALTQDPAETIYVYAQDFTIAEKIYRRSGFIALGELAEYGGAIKPHEQTLSGPKTDRLNLTRAVKTQIGQIFMLYSDPSQTVDKILEMACKQQPLLDATDEDQVRHQLFAVTDPGQIDTIQATMADKDVFIADGHHRYETALNYYRETQNPDAAFQMMTFVNLHNEGLIILPTHRLINNLKTFDPASLIEKMKADFDVAALAFSDMVEKKQKMQQMLQALELEFKNNEHAFGMYFNDGAFYVATLRDVAVMDSLAADQSAAWRKLDVAILHKLILEQHLGIDEQALKDESNVEYIKDFGEATIKALDKVDAAQAQGLFFMNPTRGEEVQAVALAGEKMPQKSTFFFPKIFSGLVLNVLAKP